MDDLKAGLANVVDGAERHRRHVLMNALGAAANAYASDHEGSAGMALAAVMDFLHDEQLEAPFRFMVDVLDAHRRKTRRTKPLQRALDEARTVATVDTLMRDQRLSLERACRSVAKATGGRWDWKQVKNLRENIIHGKSRAEATAVYEYLRRGDHHPNEPPAPLTLDAVEEIWATYPNTKSCK
ncbi:MAG: hypothetical protein EOS58_06330 [Mesorhizobium sp.]|uniref:hypothetical protein n=1 Tax=Mesorhizobium sp. M4A.F.Ca.ET.022.05.2.1 TaxID=2496653 RepID=UPI000FCB1F0E|nr:hypothetical protein [Mesorhizobium sp. M4A.F.Ca.ET.022.05.2.1]RVC75830.1 hypothetical protein EN745_26450 [Mesorhizobium sp. M4A.F.Ca.ET.022.05.2.1]RWD06622.1 MAG: hypothetical protein EOS58_06330 [Mesorhizobium sp.]